MNSNVDTQKKNQLIEIGLGVGLGQTSHEDPRIAIPIELNVTFGKVWHDQISTSFYADVFVPGTVIPYNSTARLMEGMGTGGIFQHHIGGRSFQNLRASHGPFIGARIQIQAWRNQVIPDLILGYKFSLGLPKTPFGIYMEHDFAPRQIFDPKETLLWSAILGIKFTID